MSEVGADHADLVLDGEVALLDFDGLVIDTEYAGWKSWSELYTLHGLELTEQEWAHQCGREVMFEPWEPLEARGLRDRPQLDQRRLLRRDELLVVLPGVREFLDRMHAARQRVGIVSNSPLKWIHRNLERHGIDPRSFAVIIGGKDHPPKPSPERYLRAVFELGIAPHDAVAVEDSAKGVMAAVAAGLRCVAIASRITRHSDLSGAHHRLASLRSLHLKPRPGGEHATAR